MDADEVEGGEEGEADGDDEEEDEGGEEEDDAWYVERAGDHLGRYVTVKVRAGGLCAMCWWYEQRKMS